MNQTQTIKSLKLDQWFANQLEKPDSVPETFYWTFLLHFILNHLDYSQKKAFFEILAEGGDDQILPFVYREIPNFSEKFSWALGERLKKLKAKALFGAEAKA